MKYDHDAYQKKYREDNKARMAEYQKAYREKNRARINAAIKIYREKNREMLNKKQRIYIEKKRGVPGSSLHRNTVLMRDWSPRFIAITVLLRRTFLWHPDVLGREHFH